MALKEIAVQGMTIEVTGSTVTGSVSPTGSPSIKVKAEGKGVYKDNLAVVIAIGLRDTSLLCTSTAPFPTTIPASSIKNKVENLAPLRVDDETTSLSVPGVLDAGGACSITTTVKITNAGQTKVKGE